MEYNQVKYAIKNSDKDTVREVLDTYSEEVLAAAIELDIPAGDIAEAYAGEFPSDEDFAQDMAEQLGSIDPNSIWPQSCIDWEHAAKELMYDYAEDNGHYFRNL